MTSVVVAILVKNGAQYLSEVLCSVKDQKSPFDVRLLAIDSGSTDGSLSILERQGVETILIPPSDFNHGDTRNLAAELAGEETDFVVYLTQDATPADRCWLANLVAPLLLDVEVAGAFSRHLPRERSTPAQVRQLTQVWQSGQAQRIVKEMPHDSATYEQNQLFYAYFSDTSSVIRRSVWESIPFPRVHFAEDAAWADRVLRAGYRIVFEPASRVIHSHDYSLVEQFRQNVDHVAGMRKVFPGASDLSLATWLRVFGGIPREVLADWRFIAVSDRCRSSSPTRKLFWALHSPLWHLASVCGSWLGSRLDRLQFLEVLLSRQERLRRGIG